MAGRVEHWFDRPGVRRRDVFLLHTETDGLVQVDEASTAAV
jgi:hypothetical protein